MKHPDKNLKYCPTNHLARCRNPNYVEVWIKGKRYVADWSAVNKALLDSDAKAPLREVSWSRVQLRDAMANQVDSWAVMYALLEKTKFDERSADILSEAGEEAYKRIKERFPDK